MDNTSIRVADNFDLASIKSPADIKRLTVDELQLLADRLRVPLTEKLGRHGGHVGPNLGFMEATIALHYVFDAPTDKLVFDVSHQTYPHKMLTGRIQAFLDPTHYDDVTGYTSPKESPYDLFSVGHTSTSVALTAGLAKARDMRGGKENVVAIIGDGSLSGGEAFEGLDYAATLGSNFIVVVNDNQMSIAPNHGGIYENLRLLRDTDGTAQCNLFKAMGFRYLYVPYGNEVANDYTNIGYQIVEEGKDVAVIAAGDFMQLGRDAVELMKQQSLTPTLINPRIVSDIDRAALDSLRDYRVLITLEDNSVAGGMGEKIAAYLGEAPVKVKVLGLPRALPDRYKASELMAANGLTPQAIAKAVAVALGN